MRNSQIHEKGVREGESSIFARVGTPRKRLVTIVVIAGLL